MADNPLASPASPARGLALPDSAQGTLSYLDMSPSFRDRVGADWLANMAGAEVLPCPTLRDVLEAHTSPFVAQPNQRFVSDRDRVDLQSVHFASPSSAGVGSHGGLAELARQAGEYAQLPRQAIRAGPRETIYHAPPTAHIAIVTCGGLCPGLNDVVRGAPPRRSRCRQRVCSLCSLPLLVPPSALTNRSDLPQVWCSRPSTTACWKKTSWVSGTGSRALPARRTRLSS